MFLTTDQKERHMVALLVLNLKAEHRNTMLKEKHEDLPANSPLKAVDAEVYGAYRQTAKGLPSFGANNSAVTNSFIAVFDDPRNLPVMADIQARWGSGDCPFRVEEVAGWLISEAS